MNGINAAWDNNSPSNNDLVGQGDDVIRSIRTALQQVLDDEHNFPATGGAGTGYHRLGSARPFQAAASQISSTGTIGRLMVNSNDYSLWGDTGANPVPLGHQNLFANFNASGVYQRGGVAGARTTNAMQYGFVRHDGTSGNSTVAYAGSGFSGLPVLFLFPQGENTTSPIQARIVGNPSATGFTLTVRQTGGGAVVGSVSTVNWMSVGTVASGVA